MPKKTYATVLKQIESLQAVADQMRRKEIDGVIARIKQAIEFYQLSVADLGLGPRRGRPPGKTATATAAPAKKRRGRRKAKVPAVVKYRDEAGNTWVGRGKRPQWLRDALAAGKSLSDFAV
jgi:DNA-binding protein H-NS